MSSNVALHVCKQVFKKALLAQSIAEQEPALRAAARPLSSMEPMPWSRKVYEARKCVLNLTPCGNDFEKAFAKFLDHAEDVKAFSKLPERFGFAIEYTDPAMNLRYYYPDFIAIDQTGGHWLLETKGQQTDEVLHKDRAAKRWCENATQLGEVEWRYLKVMQKSFEELKPESFAELTTLQ